MATVQSRPRLSIKQTIEHIINSGQMRRQEHLTLTSAVLSDQKIVDEDRRQINRIFDYIQTGRIKLID